MASTYVGLMSGTSMDGIDAALVRFEDDAVSVLATQSQAYTDDLRDDLLASIRLPLDTPVDPEGDLHRRVGESFRDAALALIRESGADPKDIKAIGSHGQTLRHQPEAKPPFSIQVGDPGIIVRGTGITTVANFREADMIAGGQGAPLVPPFHQFLFESNKEKRVVVNIGGIANVTILPADGSAVTGFDTGPGNGLMDRWILRQQGESFDRDGKWAASGSVVTPLLSQFLDDPYFALPPPKSTGFEYFNASWLDQFDLSGLSPEDVQTTLAELTVRSIADAVNQYAQGTGAVFVCGGGARNAELIRRLDDALPGISISSTAAAGLDPEWVEAVAFAWLAMRTMNGETGNLPSVTGASHKVVLGDIHCP